MNVLVLGGTGFLGLHVCRTLAEAGASVLQVSRTARSDPAPAQPGRITPMDHDLAGGGRPALARLLADADADVVVNAYGMAWSGTPAQMSEANARWVGDLVDVMTALPRRPRLVQIGTVHEYGAMPVGTAAAEEHPARPVTAYGRTKLLGTRTVLRAAADGLDATVLRITNACGPGAPRASLLGSVAHHLVDAAERHADGEPPEPLVFPSLSAGRDFVDVRDAAEAALAAARAPHGVATGRVVNIGGGRAAPVREAVARLVALSAVPVPVSEDEPGAAAGPTRAEWQQVDISLAAGLLGWRPRRDLDTSLNDQLTELRRDAGQREGPDRCV
ncbi:NAD(P)-dependent oxidoreductase [Streptomyces sp. CRN 30]|uniref:NAD-dependent epimerase/dehydratase family protein n=1 Tax=Streptomyces sp. CRN 30 TaxID=3075613 RepID=UPI002A828519|nr:NAD(P)-dependent oxidoreductase [Streptomyces sp. CRN 30]